MRRSLMKKLSRNGRLKTLEIEEDQLRNESVRIVTGTELADRISITQSSRSTANCPFD